MKVLIASDCSPASALVIDEAAGRPWPSGTTFSVLYVVDLQRFVGLPPLLEEHERRVNDICLVLKDYAARLERSGHKAEHQVVTGFPRRAVSEYAKEWAADLIMAGSHGYSDITRFVMGSVAQGILRTAPCSVEIVRAIPGKAVSTSSSDEMKLMLATDGSDCSVSAAHSIANRPWPAGTLFKVFTVEELAVPDNTVAASSPAAIYPQSLLEELIDRAHERAESSVESAVKILAGAGKKVLQRQPSPVGEPRSLILDAAEAWGANLIVLGSHGRRGFDRFLMGSVAESVAMHAHCSVEVFRH
jgi:nucleotide-binding universal stress UspA family protein